MRSVASSIHHFEPGSRVILHRHFAGMVAGTVIKSQLIGEKEEILALYVIFDDGSTITADANNFWLESEYDPNCPF